MRMFAGLGVSLLLASAAGAQTASQITPPSYVPPAPQPGSPLVIPTDTSTEAPPGADRAEVTLGDVSVDGGVVESEALAALRARVVGKRIKVAEVFAAARELEAGYARSGRVLTRVVVPAQNLADGATLRLVVVEGAIERIDTGTLPPAIQRRIAAVLAPLAGRSDVTQGEIERRLLLAADTPGTTLRSTLSAGSKPGATVLLVEASYRPVAGFVTLDNTLPGALGRDAFGVGLDFNSVFGRGETIYLRASGLPNTGRETSVLDPTPRNRALAGGVIAPIGNDGLTVNVEVTDARTAPRHAANLPGFGSRFTRLSGRVRYPFVRSRALTISGEATFDAQNERVRIISPLVLPLSLDRLRVARVAGDLSAYLPGGGIASARAEASFGLDVLGARSDGGASALLPVSRAGADASFQKLEISGSIDQPLAEHLALSVRARAQTSFGQVMANAEQIGIARTDGISPLPSGLVQGDAGYVGRAELRIPFAFSLVSAGAQIAPYGFGAAGGVRFENPSVFERRSTDVYALGGGVRVAGAARDGSPGLSASVEYGRAYLDRLGRNPDRVTFTVVAQF